MERHHRTKKTRIILFGKSLIDAVRQDILNDPNKYIENWNENNLEHAIPLKEKQNEQPKKDETWKDAQWHKDLQQIIAAEEKNTGEG